MGTRKLSNAGRIDALARGMTRRPALVIALVAAVTAVFAVFAPRVRIDSSVQSLVDPADPAVGYYEEVRRTFGGEEVDLVAVLADDVFTPATLGRVKAISDRLAKVRGVREVISLATARNVAAGDDGALDTAALMPTVPADLAALGRLRQAVLTNPLFRNTLVSADGRMAAIAVKYDDMPDAVFAESGIHDEVERAVAAAGGPEQVYVAGIPTLKAKAAQLMRQDLLRFTPLTALVISAVLFLSFRTLRGVVVPALTTGIGLVWTLGLMGWLGVPINVGTIVLPSLIAVIGSAYATHVVARYYEEAEPGDDGRDVAYRIVRHLGLPVFVTALTTVLGFATLAVYRVQAIRDLGLFSVFGISALFVLALTFAIAVLALLPVQPRRPGGEGEGLARFLERLGRFDMRHRWAMIGGAAVVLAGFAWGIRFIRVDTNYASYFPETSPVRVAGRAIGEHLGGTATFLVAVDGPGPDAVVRAESLGRLATLEDYIDRLPGIDSTLSFVDYMKALHRAFQGPGGTAGSLPESDAAIQQYLLLTDPELLTSVVNGDRSRAAIVVRSQLLGSTQLADTVARIERFAADLFPPGFAVHATGTSVLLNRTADDLSRGQVASFASALAVVFVTLSLQFLSLRFGLVAMVPNLVPILMFFGLLGWAGIPLSISTAMIASISLGIGVDEAVHLLSEFDHYARRYADQGRAVLAAMRSVGPPVIFATLALLLGFLVPTLSNFVPVRQFGALSAFGVGPSLLADLLVLPALIASARFVTLWDLLRVKLGEAPERTIPLFHGLRASQARIAALLGELRTVAAGDLVVRRGDPADEMYVVIRGRAEVLGGDRSRPVLLSLVERGHVAGEMGLLRHRPRTADVRALEDTEVLVVNDRFLDVLRRRYPRIAATVLLNLTRIVSDRLEATTEMAVASREGAADRPEAVRGAPR